MDCPARVLPQSVSWRDALRVAASIKVVAASFDRATSPRTAGSSPRPPLLPPGQCCCCCSYPAPPAPNSSFQEVSSLPRSYALSEHRTRDVVPADHAAVFHTRAAVGCHVEGHVGEDWAEDRGGDGATRQTRRQRRSLSPSDLPCSEPHLSCARGRLEVRASEGATCQELAEGSDEWCPESRGAGLAVEVERDCSDVGQERRNLTNGAHLRRDRLSPALEPSAEADHGNEALCCSLTLGAPETGGVVSISQGSLEAAGITTWVTQALGHPELQGTPLRLEGQSGDPRRPIIALLDGGSQASRASLDTGGDFGQQQLAFLETRGDFGQKLVALVGEHSAARFSTRHSRPDGGRSKRKASSADMTVECRVKSGMLPPWRKGARVVERWQLMATE